jgi:hypothetical protein
LFDIQTIQYTKLTAPVFFQIGHCQVLVAEETLLGHYYEFLDYFWKGDVLILFKFQNCNIKQKFQTAQKDKNDVTQICGLL